MLREQRGEPSPVGREPRPGSPFGYPEWFHNHGDKMGIGQICLEEKTLFLTSSAANLRISPRLIYEFTKRVVWDIDWEVIQGYPDIKTNGHILMENDQLATAFGINDCPSLHGQWLIDRFGGNFAEQGKYIRWKNYLNIPCPGTGHDGDPNVSIFLTEEISEAVRQILETRK